MRNAESNENMTVAICLFAIIRINNASMIDAKLALCKH